MFDLILAAVLSWTNPVVDAEGCLPGTSALNDLDVVEVWGTAAGTRESVMLAKVDARTREGAPESVSLDLAGQWSVWVVAVDVAGNRACDSPVVGVNVPPAAVADSPKEEIVYYDIAGRRVTPSTPGVYLMRVGKQRVRRVVVLR